MALVQAKGRLESAFNGWLSSGVATTANGTALHPTRLGARRNMVSGFTDQKSAIPDGHLASSAYFIPQVAGNMSSRNEASIVFATIGNAAQGINLTGSTAITFAANGDGAAVAAAIGSSTITFAASGTAVAPLNATGSATITFAATGDIRADASVSGSTVITFSSSAVTGAIGHMVATPIDVSLTPESVAEAVWDRLAAQHTTLGTFGATLTSAEKAAKLAAALSA
jgi:hypothetical protein